MRRYRQHPLDLRHYLGRKLAAKYVIHAASMGLGTSHGGDLAELHAHALRLARSAD